MRRAAASVAVALVTVLAWAAWSSPSDDARLAEPSPVRIDSVASAASSGSPPPSELAAIEPSRDMPSLPVEVRTTALPPPTSPPADVASPLAMATRSAPGPDWAPGSATAPSSALPPGVRAQDVEVNGAGMVSVLRNEPVPGAQLPAADGIGFGAAATPGRLRFATSSAP